MGDFELSKVSGDLVRDLLGAQDNAGTTKVSNPVLKRQLGETTISNPVLKR